MFSVEVKINGSIIGHLYGHNEGPTNKFDSDERLYSYEWYEPGRGNKEIKIDGVKHNRDEGMVKLLSKIFKKLEK